jgi:hypothetical protein
MPEYDVDLEQVYNDQGPNVFTEKAINLGIARCFIEDIGKWVQNVKKAIPVLEII